MSPISVELSKANKWVAKAVAKGGPPGGTYSWSSLDGAVASAAGFSSGTDGSDTAQITGVSAGETSVLVTYSGPAGQCSTVVIVKVLCPEVEIEINDTPTTDDDYVRLKCTNTAKRWETNCRIRVKDAPAIAATVVLTNPDGRLRFPNPADKTTTVTVPADGSWVSFKVSGENGSAALQDAVIEAHCRTEKGPLIGKKPMTVFWFDEGKIDIAVGGDYAWVADSYTSSAAPAVSFTAQARIRPAGVNCAAPQVKDLRVGIMQNTFPPRGRTRTWADPTIVWNPGVPAGASVTVPSVMHTTTSVPASANDSEATVDPLYDQPGKGGTIDANSLQPPMGCAGGAAATSNDTPGTPVAPTFVAPAVLADGTVVGQVTWGTRKLVHKDNFVTWSVIFDTVSSHVCAIRERAWTLNMDSSAASQHPVVGADRAPTTAMVTSAPYSNTRSNDPANLTSGAQGAATTNFVHP